MERVTDEWLERADVEASKTAGMESDKDVVTYMRDHRRAWAQAVARECIEVIMCFNDRDEGVRNIRARFGLEDDRG